MSGYLWLVKHTPDWVSRLVLVLWFLISNTPQFSLFMGAAIVAATPLVGRLRGGTVNVWLDRLALAECGTVSLLFGVASVGSRWPVFPSPRPSAASLAHYELDLFTPMWLLGLLLNVLVTLRRGPSGFRIVHAGVTLGGVVAWKLCDWSQPGGFMLLGLWSPDEWIPQLFVDQATAERSFQFQQWMGAMITPIQPLFAVAWVVRKIRRAWI